MYSFLLSRCLLSYVTIPKSEFSAIDNRLIDVKSLISPCFSLVSSTLLLTDNSVSLFWLIAFTFILLLLRDCY